MRHRCSSSYIIPRAGAQEPIPRQRGGTGRGGMENEGVRQRKARVKEMKTRGRKRWPLSKHAPVILVLIAAECVQRPPPPSIPLWSSLPGRGGGACTSAAKGGSGYLVQRRGHGCVGKGRCSLAYCLRRSEWMSYNNTEKKGEGKERGKEEGQMREPVRMGANEGSGGEKREHLRSAWRASAWTRPRGVMAAAVWRGSQTMSVGNSSWRERR
jgi:hypothetical protein